MNSDRAARRVIGSLVFPLLISALFISLGLVIHHQLFFTFINGEDCLWIHGDMFGWGDRTIQHYLLHELFRRSFGPHIEALYVASIGLHILIALLIYVFFYTLVTSTRTDLGNAAISAHCGGGAAGLLYLIYHSTNLAYLSAVSYQLCAVFCLIGLIFAMRFLTSRRAGYWVAVALTWALALNTHSFSYGFPLLVVLLELYQRGSHRPTARYRWILLRYALLLGVLLVHLAMHQQALAAQWGKVIPPPLELLREPSRAFGFLASTFSHFIARSSPGNLPALIKPLYSPAPLSAGWSGLVMFALAAAMVVSLAVTVFQLVRRRTLGLAAIFFFTVPAWNIVIYLQIRHAPYLNAATWRYEMTVAGYCLFLAYAGMSAVHLALRLLSRRPARALPGAVLFIALTGAILIASWPDQRLLLDSITGGRP